MSLTLQVKEYARQLGFELVGITSPQPPPGLDRFQAWLEQGHAGEMAYLQKGAELRSDPAHLLPGVRSMICLSCSYHQPAARTTKTSPLQGRVATYAEGADYHEILWRKLNKLAGWLGTEVPGSTSRGVVDTAPLLEREYARLAGLGWFGKNTMLINKQQGSFFFLATLLTTAELDADPPHLARHCGTCTACLDACPTRAFPKPGVLDARKCISYLTIELRESIPVEYRSAMGDWVFGCDVCQDVCPWNRKAPAGKEAAFLPTASQATTLDLLELFDLTPEQFRHRFKSRALWRTRRRGLLRNAAIVLGNRRDPRAVPTLVQALGDDEPLIRGAAAWALGCFDNIEAQAALTSRQPHEVDATVRDEIRAALGAMRRSAGRSRLEDCD